MNKKFLFLLFGIVLIANINFIISQEEISLLDGKVTGQGFGFREFSEKEISLGQDGVAQITFEDKNSRVKIKDDIFENINSDELAYVNIDKDGNIVKADFSVNEKGGNYCFGNTCTGILPANSRVFFDKKMGIRIIAEEDAEFTETPRQKNLNLPEGYLTTIESPVDGNFKLPNGVKVYGKINYKDGLLFVKEGDEVEIGDARIYASKKDVYFFYDDDFFPEAYSNKNYYFSNGKKEILNSNFDGEVNIEYLAGNKLFNMYKIENSLKIPDKKDFFRLDVKSGDSLEVTDRSGSGLIPEIKHVRDSNGGITAIYSGRMNFVIDDKIYLIKPTDISLHPLSKQESVPFQLESENTGQVLRTSSSNLFLISSSDKDLGSRVSFNSNSFKNPEGVIVSELISDNELQTLSQLKAKYSQLNFVQGKNPESYSNDPSIDLITPTPYTIQLVNNWFEEDPSRIERYETVEFINEFNAYSAYVSGEGNLNVLVIGERLTDPYGGVIRDVSNLQALIHEDEHSQDHLVGYAEEKILSNPGNLPAEVLNVQEEREKIFRGEYILNYEKLLKRHSEIVPKDISPGGFLDIVRSDVEYVRLLEEKQEITDRMFDLRAKELEVLNLNPNTKTLQSFYNDFSYNSALNLVQNEIEQIDKYRKIYAKIYVLGLKNKYGIDLDVDSIISEHGDSYVYNAFKSKFGKDRNKWPEGADIIEERGATISNLGPKVIGSKVDYFKKTSTIEGQKKIEIHSGGFDKIIEEINQIGIDLSHAGQKEISQEILELPRKYGLPDVYATYNYGRSGTDSRQFAQIAEVSSTYRELPISVRTDRANSDNPYVRDAYRKLTQLAFDSGKMEADEYKAIMGESQCKEANCCDQKCVMYKLTCTGSC